MDENYLKHYGVSGMQWRYKKGPSTHNSNHNHSQSNKSRVINVKLVKDKVEPDKHPVLNYMKYVGSQAITKGLINAGAFYVRRMLVGY